VEIEKGEYTEKDRIVRNMVYSVKIQLKWLILGWLGDIFAGINTILFEINKKYRIIISNVGKNSGIHMKICG